MGRTPKAAKKKKKPTRVRPRPLAERIRFALSDLDDKESAIANARDELESALADIEDMKGLSREQREEARDAAEDALSNAEFYT